MNDNSFEQVADTSLSVDTTPSLCGTSALASSDIHSTCALSVVSVLPLQPSGYSGTLYLNQGFIQDFWLGGGAGKLLVNQHVCVCVGWVGGIGVFLISYISQIFFRILPFCLTNLMPMHIKVCI